MLLNDDDDASMVAVTVASMFASQASLIIRLQFTKLRGFAQLWSNRSVCLQLGCMAHR